ncbi:MAG: hypothetical protein ILP24_04460 [Paludibacteraceae bacterium]|nr:hypothetical protein [Paludibacteraceae bacterium]
MLGEHEEWLQMLLRFGLCCKAKEKTVGDLCASSAFSDDLLLCVLNVLQDKNYRLQGDIQTYALLQLVDYHEREDAFLEKYIEGYAKKCRVSVRCCNAMQAMPAIERKCFIRLSFRCTRGIIVRQPVVKQNLWISWNLRYSNWMAC